MSRARLIVKQITIQKRGEVNFFQIRLPKNVVRITGIETDVVMLSTIEADSSGGSHSDGSGGVRPDGTSGGVVVNRRPFMLWRSISNPVVGKLKLQSMNRYNIFFDTWIPFVFLNASMPDMSYGIFSKSPYSLIVKSELRTTNIPCSSNILYGFFSDDIGIRRNADTRYTVKVFVWVQTTEVNRGVIYEFENKSPDVKP
ncbi:hypothetical protein CNR22_13490 [Sphingobacteriaceae bacterium]|nr:hypothetical protein CNR22_13490 [Sphingobacteriaceae bacterium]